MRLLVLSVAIAATVLGALPASAEVVIRERGDAVVVRENADRGRHEGWRKHHADCREVRVRTRLSNGTVIFKTRRVC